MSDHRINVSFNLSVKQKVCARSFPSKAKTSLKFYMKLKKNLIKITYNDNEYTLLLQQTYGDSWTTENKFENFKYKR